MARFEIDCSGRGETSRGPEIGGLGNMGQIFHFAFMRRRVRHGALRMRLRSHVRSAVKTASWRAFAAVDTFALVWLFSGHDTTHAIAAAGAVVSVEAITKSFLYFAHERLWEAPVLSYLKMTADCPLQGKPGGV